MDLNPKPTRPGWPALLGRLILLVALVTLPPTRSEARSPVDTPSPTTTRVRAALKGERFPWYDSERDRVRAIRFQPDPDPPRPSSTTTTGGGSASWGWNWNLGDLIVFLASVLALGALVGLVAWTWRRFEPESKTRVPEVRPGRSATAEPLLPADLRVATTDDPWSEAVRRRAAGDLAGAVVCVFVHQVLAAARLDLVRLGPDRTPRQIQRAVRDAEFRALMAPSLQQFEIVYYGHRDPDPGDFARFWAAAEAFQQRLGQPRRTEGVTR